MNALFHALSVLCLLALSSQPAVGEPVSAPHYPPHVIPNSQLRVLPGNSHGRQYQLHVGLPPSYAVDTRRRYPVVFVTDGYWDFVKLDAIRGVLLYDKQVPECILVGLGYPGEGLDYGEMRRWELSPVTMDGDKSRTGHADLFLRSLEEEILPYVDAEFRTDPRHRILGGASLGGLFTLYAMYARPGLFEGYIAVTPAVMLGGEWLLGYEEERVKAGVEPRGRLFVSIGGNEWPNFTASVLRYHARLSSRGHAGLAWEFRILEGLRHGGMQLDSYTRGMLWVLAPLAPERGPLQDF